MKSPDDKGIGEGGDGGGVAGVREISGGVKGLEMNMKIRCVQ
jgi:hypothetical protein